MLEKTDNEQRAKIFTALSEPTRLRIVELLAECGEISSSDIAAHLGISLALFCQQSKTLYKARLVEKRKAGLTKYNSLNRALLTSCLDLTRLI